MPALAVRVISAVCAACLLFASHLFFKLNGLIGFSIVICTLGAFEYSRLVYTQSSEKWFKLIFPLFAAVTFLTIFFIDKNLSLSSLLISFVLFVSSSLWLVRGCTDLQHIQSTCYKAALGFLYAIALPTTIIDLLARDEPLPWFFLLLTVTFAGDIFAYFGGITFGKHKLMPALSPKKSVEGAISGLIGSVIVAIVFTQQFLPNLNIGLVIAWSLLTSFVCQTGDLFESLLKRSAGVKDSGKIMPGHGGVLDRLDGVYFGAPGLLLLYGLSAA